MSKEIERVWKTEQEILDVVHEICVKHNLRYSLAYGTLIGAVRHKGFIPWDDDIDIMMPRDDYEKLRKIWLQISPKGYILQDGRTNPDFSQNFLKIRKDHTVFLQDEGERRKSYHKGIFIDIFPGDRVPLGRISRIVQYSMCAINLLYSRGFRSGNGGLIGMIENVLLRLPQKYHQLIRSTAERGIQHWNREMKGPYVFASTIEVSKQYYPSDMFDNLMEIEFNGKQYFCVKDTDTVLRIGYGDYMQLPPESERVWKHHPIIIDFEHNYEELNLQK